MRSGEIHDAEHGGHRMDEYRCRRRQAGEEA